MIVVLAVVLALFATAIVVLYAMLGELASRIQSDGAVADRVRSLPQYEKGTTAGYWPADLTEISNAPEAIVLVLSPICNTCTKVAEELATFKLDSANMPIGIVVSASERKAGDDFVASHSLSRFPCFVDDGGKWITESFGVNTSPTALLTEGGRLVAAYTFTTVIALIRTVTGVREGVS